MLVCAGGFVADHLEVLYDLDIEAARRAARHGLAFARTACVNDDPAVMAALASASHRRVVSSDRRHRRGRWRHHRPRRGARGRSAPGRSVTLFEAGDRLGGKIRTTPFAGHPAVDEGADAFLARVPWAVELARKVALGDR